MLIILPNAQYPVATGISFALAIIVAFAYHEFAHAVIADRLGDPTPRAYGRMTLNPVAHLDRTGLFLALLFGFGWASTPVNPSRLNGNPRVSYALVALGGPVANLIMALLFALPILLGLVTPQPPSGVMPSLYSFLAMVVFTNLLLFAFNMLPIPPLDGFSILQGVLPAELAYSIAPLRQYGLLILILVLFLLPRVTGIDIIGAVIFPMIRFFLLLFIGSPPIVYF